MVSTIDTTFDVYSDTPVGKDPDRFSPTLRRYHQILWSKKLPGGAKFSLLINYPKTYLYHKSELGEFFLSSDSIGHTYRHVRACAPLVNQVPKAELDIFYALCSTIGAYVLFPSQRVDMKPTINGARGLHWKIRDRFDLTLECIRLHYIGQANPLSEVLARYTEFFQLFGNFKGYAKFFLLHDLLSSDDNAVNFFLPFSGFDAPPLFQTLVDYRVYKDRLSAFLNARNRRIAEQAASE